MKQLINLDHLVINFINERYHQDSMDELEKLISKSRKGELFIQHHFKKYNGIMLIWAAIEVTSFGFPLLHQLQSNPHLLVQKTGREPTLCLFFVQAYSPRHRMLSR